MPLYENRINALNTIEIDKNLLSEVKVGNQSVVKTLVEKIVERKATKIAIEGWYGVDFKNIFRRTFKTLPSSYNYAWSVA